MGRLGTAEEMAAVVLEYGITSFKVFMAYKGAIMVDDHALYQVMKVAAETGAVVTVHAENGDVVWNLQQELLAKGLTGGSLPLAATLTTEQTVAMVDELIAAHGDLMPEAIRRS